MTRTRGETMVRKGVKKVAKVGIRIAKYAKKEIDKELGGMIKKGAITSAKGIKLARRIARRAIAVTKDIDNIIRKELREKPKKAKRKKKR